MDSLVEDCRLDDAIMAPPWGQLGRAATLGVVAGFSKLMLNVLNTTNVVNHETYLQAVTERVPGTGLITVCNHTRCVQDAWLGLLKHGCGRCICMRSCSIFTLA